jgi:hypothetical protein
MTTSKLATGGAHTQAEEDSVSNEWWNDPNKPSIDQRLQQIYNFLADEDYTRVENFNIRLENEIRPFIERCETIGTLPEKTRRRLQDVKTMMGVHISWNTYDQHDQRPTLNFGHPQPWSERFQVCAKTTRSSPLKTEWPDLIFEDHPVFTLIRSRFHKMFLDQMNTNAVTLHQDNEIGIIDLEEQSYQNVVNNPQEIPVILNLDWNNEEHVPKAVLRGTQRGAIELALRLFADNGEQHWVDDTLRAVKILKEEPVTIPEARLCLPKDPSRAIPVPDMFKYTKSLIKYRRYKRQLAARIRFSEISEHENSLTYVPPPPNFDGPVIPVFKNQVDAMLLKKQNQLLAIVECLRTAESLATRPLIREVLLRITQGVQYGDQTEDLSLLPQMRCLVGREQNLPLLKEETNFLLHLAEASENTHQVPYGELEDHVKIFPRNVRGGLHRAMPLASEVVEAYPNLEFIHDAEEFINQVIRLSQAPDKAKVIPAQHRDQFLRLLNKISYIRYLSKYLKSCKT